MKKNKKDFHHSHYENTEDLTPEEDIIDETEERTDESEPAIDLTAENESLKEEIKKLKEDYLRAFADAENTKKRCAQEIEKNNKYAISSFGKSLLSVADNLHRAIEAVSTDDNKANYEALLKGVELTEAELTKVFNKFGIAKMDIMGKVFDPNFHQVIQEVEDQTKPTGTIIAELQTGYMLNDRLLREAMVVVTKGGTAQ